MEVLLETNIGGKVPPVNDLNTGLRLASERANSNALIVENLLTNKNNEKKSRGGFGDAVAVDMNAAVQGIVLTADEIVSRLNEMLSDSLPGGIESLQAEDVTAEATAERIVTGISALFSAYAEQHPELVGEDLLGSFMKEARKGVEQGYGEAVDTLEGLGAFNFEGVKEGVQETKSLIEIKLEEYEQKMRVQLGLEDEETVEQVAKLSSEGIETFAAGSLSVEA